MTPAWTRPLPPAANPEGWPALPLTVWEDTKDTTEGAARELRLEPRSVADFYAETMARLDEYPAPPSYAGWSVKPLAAHYDLDWREFLLPYEAVRSAEDPDGLLLSFLQSTYEAAAESGGLGPRGTGKVVRAHGAGAASA